MSHHKRSRYAVPVHDDIYEWDAKHRDRKSRPWKGFLLVTGTGPMVMSRPCGPKRKAKVRA